MTDNSTNAGFDLVIEPNRTTVAFFRELLRYRELFYFLAWRDILVHYKQTVIGMPSAWRGWATRSAGGAPSARVSATAAPASDASAPPGLDALTEGRARLGRLIGVPLVPVEAPDHVLL